MTDEAIPRDGGAVCARMEAEVLFFEGAVDRARRWQRTWNSAGMDAREDLLAEHARLIAELLGREETLDGIRDAWAGSDVSWDGDSRNRARSLAGRLDTAMRNLLDAEKENIEATGHARDEILRRILEVRKESDLHRVYAAPSDTGPACVDRKL